MWLPLSPRKCHFSAGNMSCFYLLTNTNGDRCLLSHEQRTGLAMSETSIHLTWFFASALVYFHGWAMGQTDWLESLWCGELERCRPGVESFWAIFCPQLPFSAHLQMSSRPGPGQGQCWVGLRSPGMLLIPSLHIPSWFLWISLWGIPSSQIYSNVPQNISVLAMWWALLLSLARGGCAHPCTGLRENF